MNEKELLAEFEKEQALIAAVLEVWAAETHKILDDTLVKKRLVASGALRRSLKYQVTAQGQGKNYVRYEFLLYGRYLDAIGKRGLSLRGANKVITVGGKKRKINGAQKDMKWYSKNMWGRINPLVDALGKEYALFVKKQFKLLNADRPDNAPF